MKHDEFPGIKTFESEATWGETLEEMLRAEQERLEVELYGAWRAGYDFLYVVTQDAALGEGPLSSKAYIPSDDPDRRFLGFWSERYDLRGRNMPPEARDVLEEFNL